MHGSTRITRIGLATWGLTLASVGCFGAEPRIYGLVSAMGDQFSAMHEELAIGSRLPNTRRRAIDAPGDLLNKLALQSVDTAVGGLDPASQRVYFSIALSRDIQDRPRALEEAAFARALQSLREMPQRSSWYRVVVITPTLQIQRSSGGLTGEQQGIGVFMQPLCQSDLRDCDRAAAANSGVDVKTPEGESARASRFIAPYFFAKVWILEPQTLEVIDTQVMHDHTKMWDPKSDTLDMTLVIDRKVLAARIVEQVQASAREALQRSELRGKVDVNERGVR
jgi:hypothetical protein